MGPWKEGKALFSCNLRSGGGRDHFGNINRKKDRRRKVAMLWSTKSKGDSRWVPGKTRGVILEVSNIEAQGKT